MITQCFEAIEPLLGTRSACAAVGRPRATHYRRRRPKSVGPPQPRRRPANALTKQEIDAVLAELRSERFVDLSPAQVFHVLLDEGVYLASESTMYRLLRGEGEVGERRRQATHPPRVRPELVARRPNAVWSWDITKLKGPNKGDWYDLSVVLDIFSRYVVAWCVAPAESGLQARSGIVIGDGGGFFTSRHSSSTTGTWFPPTPPRCPGSAEKRISPATDLCVPGAG